MNGSKTMGPNNPNRKLKVLGWWLHGLGLAAALAIVLFAQLAVLRRIDEQAAACSLRAGQLEELLEDADRVRAEHARLTRELAVARRQAADLARRVPDEPQEADFLAQVSRLADDAGLEIQDYRPGTVTAEPSYSVVRVDLVCRGDYTGICRFLNGLADLPRHSTVSRLQIQSEESRGKCSVTMSLQLYFGVKARTSVGKKGVANA